MEKKQVIDVDGCRVLLLPCDTYNFSPENKYKEICSALSEKVVLHFKGERKRLMPHFWKAWINSRRFPGKRLREDYFIVFSLIPDT